MSFVKELTKGIIKENPIFVIVLGMCPTLAVSTSVNMLWEWVWPPLLYLCAPISLSR